MNLNFLLTKLFQFVTFALFIFMTLVYFGVLLLLPLDFLFQVVRLLHSMGLPAPVSLPISGALLVYIGYQIYRMPDLYTLVIDIGRQLITFGHAQIKRFDPLIELTKQPG
jgi:hypothetical protein